MIVVGGADEPVVGNVHQLPKVLYTVFPFHDTVHKLLGGDSGGSGFVFNLLSVLVGTR